MAKKKVEDKYPKEDVDLGGSPAVPYYVREAQTKAAREKHGEEAEVDTSDFIAETDGSGNPGTSSGYRAFDSGVDEVETHPAPNLDGSFAGDQKGDEAVNFADNGSTESEDRTAAASVDGDGDNTKDPAKSESSAKKAKASEKKVSGR